MVGVGHQQQHQSLNFRTRTTFVGVVLLVFFTRSADAALGEPSWQLSLRDSTAHVNNAQEFYEALVLAADERHDCSVIYLRESFAIRGAVWSPRIVISKNITIKGAHQDIEISITKSTTIVEIQNGTLAVQGFRFRPLDDGEPEEFREGWQSRPAWFELGDNAAAYFKDMVWDVDRRFRLTNRPVHIDPAHPDFVNTARETDDAMIFVKVVLPPCTFVNARFRHNASIVSSTAESPRPLVYYASSPEDLRSTLGRIHEGQPNHARIVVERDMGFNGSHSQIDAVQVSTSISITQSGRATLWLAPDSGSKFLKIAPEGHVHFERMAVELSRSKKQTLRIQDDIRYWFPLVQFPDASVGPRCLVSVRESFFHINQCRVIRDVKRNFPASYLQDIDYGKHFLYIRRFVGSGVCMEEVILTCEEKRRNEFLHNRNAFNHSVRIMAIMLEKMRASDSSDDRTLVFVMGVFGALLLVSVLALLAHWGHFGLPKYLDRKRRNLSRKQCSQQEPQENGCFVIVSVSSDMSNLTKGSRNVSAVQNLSGGNGGSESDQSTLDRHFVGSSVWTPGVGLPTLNDEEVVEIEYPVGHGGFGVVYKGMWKGQPVAVKSLVFEQSKASFGAECPKKQRAILEAGIGSIVNHPNIVQTYTYTIESPGVEAEPNKTPCQTKMYMVQEYCELGSLRMAMERDTFVCATSKGPSLRCILSAAKDVAQGMSYLHQRNIIHGDLTAKNILLQASDDSPQKIIAKICDFGLSVKLKPADSQLTNCKAGTPLYMAPEVGTHGILSKAADVYSFGIVLWEMFRRSLKSGSWGTCKMVMDFPAECPLRLALLTCWCLSPRPSDRPEFDVVLAIVEDLTSRIGTPEFDLNRGAKRFNRKLAAKMLALCPRQIQEFLMGGSLPHKPLFEKEKSLPSNDQHVYCLTLKTVKLENNDEALSFGWRVCTNSLCSAPLGPIIVSEPLSSNRGGEDIEVLSQGQSSEQSWKERGLEPGKQICSKPGQDKSPSVKTSDAEAMVAWLHWQSDVDTKSSHSIEAKSICAGSKAAENHSSEHSNSPWRSGSLPSAIEKMIISYRK